MNKERRLRLLVERTLVKWLQIVVMPTTFRSVVKTQMEQEKAGI